jgi:hypothetical protein
MRLQFFDNMSGGTKEARGVIVTALEAEGVFEGSYSYSIKTHKTRNVPVIYMGVKVSRSKRRK